MGMNIPRCPAKKDLIELLRALRLGLKCKLIVVGKSH